MNTKIFISSLLVLFCNQVLAADGKITINSPANGAMVSTKSKVAVNYEAVLGADGDHLHLYVDGKRVDVLRPLKGSADIDPLSAGKHKICLSENTKSHMATGVESCIEVTAQ